MWQQFEDFSVLRPFRGLRWPLRSRKCEKPPVAPLLAPFPPSHRGMNFALERERNRAGFADTPSSRIGGGGGGGVIEEGGSIPSTFALAELTARELLEEGI